MKLIEALDIQLKDRLMLSLVGGGGKTTIMFRLAQELRARNKRVLVTTTTHIYNPDPSLYDCFFWWNDIKKNVIELPHLEQASITVAASGITGDTKLVGIGRECVDELYESNIFDAILVEADGAKGRPIKAPDAHEPVIPGLTSMLVGVIGMDCLGKPIDPAWVHRPRIFSALAGRDAGDIIDEDVIEKLVLSRDGLFKGCPGKAEKILFMNKADSQELVLAAKRTGNTILEQNQGIRRVLIGCNLGKEPVISAAGRQT
jgi:probable selenium-dependent hydroxylase accessory protein YqeC